MLHAIISFINRGFYVLVSSESGVSCVCLHVSHLNAYNGNICKFSLTLVETLEAPYCCVWYSLHTVMNIHGDIPVSSIES